MARRQVTMVKDLEIAPVPHMPAEAVTENTAIVTESPDGDLIIQTKVFGEGPSASETYLDAMPATVAGSNEADVLRRTSQRAGQLGHHQTQSMVEWNVGTSGSPKFGSRSLRLCLGQPRFVAGRIPLIPSHVLLVGGDPHRDAQEDLVRWSATLPVRRAIVPVELRLVRFNARLTLAEIRITGQRRYPRRFFATAHGALAYLEAERFAAS